MLPPSGKIGMTEETTTFVMRVHACRHCGEVFPSYSDLRQHLDSHASGHKCATCGRAFTRRDHLQQHASRCRPKPFACDVCNSSFGRKQDLDRHKRTVQCGSPPQPWPAPKRLRIASLDEDPLTPPPAGEAYDELSAGLRDFVHENWASVRTHVVTGPVQTRYNHRLTSLDTRDLHDQLRVLFDQQTTAFKINCSFAFILKNKTTNRLKYYHSSNNCCGRLLEEPSLITNRGDFDRFLERIHQPDILQWAVAQRPNSDWICEMVTNATFFSDKVQWSARHVPLSVSVASNVPGYEPAQCYVTDGDSDKLVADMMDHLTAISDAAYESLLSLYADVLEELKTRKEAWDEEEEEEEENGKKTVNPCKTLEKQLQTWLRQLPVIGFNSGHYDINVVKKFFIPYMLKGNEKTSFVIKRQNTFMCFATKKLKFLDITSYLAPGYSYDKYLKAYGCNLQKGHFPCEYMDDLHKLEDRALPPQEAFYSRLKNEGISNDDYARCQAVWRNNQTTTMRDYLIWYNNRDVTPFLEAISKQFAFYRDRDIDMFKAGISVPGLSLLHLFNDLPNDIFFTIFNQTNSDLHKLVKDNIVGGPAIIFHRYHEKGITKIRGGEELCRKIEGYDANALYLWALMQDMPTGWYVRRREENGFRPQQAQPYGQMAVQWINCESDRTGCTIRHQANGREKRIGKLLVDSWCAETRTAYQFHGCFWHGCPKCYEQNETNSVNGKTMAALLKNTRCNTAYLRCHVKVVEMWECEWKEIRKEPDVKSFLAPARRQKWNMTQNEILAVVIDGTLFGMIECDIHVPPELRPYFSEMQPIFKNTNVSRDDIGPYMRQYAEENDIMSIPRRMLIGSYRGENIILATPLLRWYLAYGLVVDHVYQIIEYEPNGAATLYDSHGQK